MSTSRDAFEAIADQLPTVHSRLLHVYRRSNQPLTANEAARECEVRFGQYERETYRKGVHVLEKQQQIRVCGKRLCFAKPGRTKVKVYKLVSSNNQPTLFIGN
jgi:hypothetical protein